MSAKFDRRITKFVRENRELVEEVKELREALELCVQLMDRYRRALTRAKGSIGK